MAHGTDPIEIAREIAHEVVEPRAAGWDAKGSWPEEAVRALQRSGLAGLVVPQEQGGLGHGMSVLLRVCAQLGHADASAALCFGMHCVATACIATKARAQQVEAFMAPIVRGDHWTTLALSETATGSHFYLPQTTMAREGSGYRLQGTKSFVTNGGHADSYVVSTSMRGAGPGEFSMLLVPGKSVADRWGPAWEGMGMRGNSSRNVCLDDVLVDGDHLLGVEGDQIWYVFNVVAPYFLVAMAGTYLGLSERAFEEAAAHLKRRAYTHTGGTLGEIGTLQHRLGTTWATLRRTRQLCYWAAEEAERGGPEGLAALCSAKAEVAHAAERVVNEALTLTGGQGYRAGSVLHRLLRDARAAHVMAPTTDILYTWAGRALLDLPLLGQ